MATRISIDVDLTLVNANGELIPGAVEGLKTLKDKGYLLTLWSYGGEEYARSIARKHHLCCYFDGYATKPDLVIDDDAESLSQLPVVDALDTIGNTRHWSQLAKFTIQLADDLDNKTNLKNVPPWIQAMAGNKFDVEVQCAVAIWNQRDTYIRWPRRQRLLLDGTIRHPDGNNQNCYDYPPQLVEEIIQAGLPDDRRNNAPAILAFLLAGGDRPRRPFPSTWAWTIHHIYDGQHPKQNLEFVPRAVADGKLFTEAAGLVAVHPLADYVATNVPLLAWLLRWEAFHRFKHDPMGVFQKTRSSSPGPSLDTTEQKVLTVPAGITLAQIARHKVYSCPVTHPDHALGVMVFAPRDSNNRIHNLYRIKERVIADPRNDQIVSQAIRAYLNDAHIKGSKIAAGRLYRFYCLEDFAGGSLSHTPRVETKGGKHGYLSLRDLLSGKPVVSLKESCD